ncbi:tRNA-2-methylthio-N(6)-dimethylallyladenosine synthase [Candidatus Desulfarcum epimagneticum]|uniref:tRNA-2-methylthio-N(6)-dimethylallyladenosine synthase n=1 Tax=uncultured Desulfobacteraceae bacterium TaxID=218296 RepID=A0A484HFF8_9BACT|nr:tRNA-2-methylthio-N(6)-dimethylallyladenosine synthase [uncultured Desulfobacteraceae bacterium]
MGARKYVCVHTIGCQMNVYDSGRMTRMARSMGYEPVPDMKKADLIIVNTCSVREKAHQKALSFMGRMARLKRKRPDILIGVAGCVAQQEGERLLGRPDGIDFVVGTGAIDRLPEIIRRVEDEKRAVADVSMDENAPSVHWDAEPPAGDAFKETGANAFVTIMRGCDNFCAYCVVPHVRGREISRPPEDIRAEVRRLTDSGVAEITLLGQNVNSYGKKGGSLSFPGLLAEINDTPGLKRLRFTTSHPRDLSDDLIRSFRDLDRLCGHIHLPVQSGSDAVLKRMNRKYTRELYLEKIEKLRAARPDIAVTTDMIVGFPGETGADFQKTLELMDHAFFDGVFAFIYSDRPKTAALKFEGKVSEGEKKARLKTLLDAQEAYTLEKNRALEGSVRQVLVEGPSKKKTPRPQWTGRTSSNKVVNFEWDGERADIRPGRIIRVRIEKGLPHSLRGTAQGAPFGESRPDPDLA